MAGLGLTKKNPWRNLRGLITLVTEMKYHLKETHEAHIPAQYSPPGKDPRLSAAHEYPRRPRHSCYPTCQRPHPPLRLSTLATRNGCLLKGWSCWQPSTVCGVHVISNSCVATVKKFWPPGLVMHVCPGMYGSSPSLVGLTVGKDCGNAVERHRASRRIRAAMRPVVQRLPPGHRSSRQSSAANPRGEPMPRPHHRVTTCEGGSMNWLRNTGSGILGSGITALAGWCV